MPIVRHIACLLAACLLSTAPSSGAAAPFARIQ